jgi:hypothetical protein
MKVFITSILNVFYDLKMGVVTRFLTAVGFYFHTTGSSA